VTYRAELSGRALKQMHGLPGSAFDSLIEAIADVIDYPDDPLRTFPNSDPYVRRAEFGDVGLITYLINDGASKVIILDITWAGQQFLHTRKHDANGGRGPRDGRCLLAAQREHEHPRNQRGPDEKIRRSRGHGRDRARGAHRRQKPRRPAHDQDDGEAHVNQRRDRYPAGDKASRWRVLATISAQAYSAAEAATHATTR